MMHQRKRPIAGNCGGLKPIILCLLISNTIYYAMTHRVTDCLDASAWLALLLSFELEARYRDHPLFTRLIPINRLGRLLAVVVIALVYAAFIRESAWLDVINSALWLIAVVLLEIESRFPGWVLRFPLVFKVMGAAVFLALIGLSVVWAIQGAWFDAYDALVWIVALVIIDLDVLRRMPPKGSE